VIPKQTGVLVVGGGPVGLVASGLLSRLGVPSLVVERRAKPSRAPAAHVIRRRPMEILAQLGVADEVRRARPALPIRYITWCSTLGGTEAGRLDLSGPDGEEPWTHCPQNLLEPILREAVSREPAAKLAFGAECLGIAQDGRGVSARVRGDDGREHVVEAAWAIAADGAGSPVRRALDVPMLGTGPIGRFFMVHFEADLSPWIMHRPGPIFWILNPESPGALIVHDPKSSHVFMTPVRDLEEEEETLPERLSAALGVPSRAKILSVDRWSPHAQVAARYREGCIFLAGDAAHRFPPTGGLGLNTGILDVHDLVPRLASVIAGRDESLLDDYEAGCRPVAVANTDASFENMKRLGEVSRAIGPCRDLASLERRLASMTRDERGRLAGAIEAQRSHFLSDGGSLGLS